MKCLTGIAIPDTYECGEKALVRLIEKIPPGKLSNVLSISAMAGLAVVLNPALPENEVHVVSYRKDGTRILHKIFNLEVS